MRINIARALNLAADDPEGWKKAGIFAGIFILCMFTSFAIIPALFMMLYVPGYTAQVVRNVATGEEGGRLPQPASASGAWHGLLLFVIGVVYSLPLMGVMFVGFGGAIMAAATSAQNNSNLMAMSSLGAFGLVGLVACFLGLVIAVLAPMVMLQYVKRYQFGDAFNVGEIFAGIMKSPVDYLMVLLVPFGLNIVLMFLPFINLFLTPFVTIIAAHLIGQYGATVLDMHQGSTADNTDIGFSRF
jgi:hypothetical protein